jgi:hypothetical protein
MFNAANRPPNASRAPKKEVEPPKNVLEQSKVSDLDTPLYHGTTHFFRSGEVLEPRHSVMSRFKNPPLKSLVGANVPSAVRNTDYVYSTSNLRTAKNYALQAAEGRDHRYAPVYEVEPTGDLYSLHKLLSNQDPKAPKYPQALLQTHTNSYISDKEMVPKTIKTWVENPAGSKIPKEFDAMVRAASAMLGAPAPTYETKAERFSKQFANVVIPTVYFKK